MRLSDAFFPMFPTRSFKSEPDRKTLKKYHQSISGIHADQVMFRGQGEVQETGLTEIKKQIKQQNKNALSLKVTQDDLLSGTGPSLRLEQIPAYSKRIGHNKDKFWDLLEKALSPSRVKKEENIAICLRCLTDPIGYQFAEEFTPHQRFHIGENLFRPVENRTTIIKSLQSNSLAKYNKSHPLLLAPCPNRARNMDAMARYMDFDSFSTSPQYSAQYDVPHGALKHWIIKAAVDNQPELHNLLLNAPELELPQFVSLVKDAAECQNSRLAFLLKNKRIISHLAPIIGAVVRKGDEKRLQLLLQELEKADSVNKPQLASNLNNLQYTGECTDSQSKTLTILQEWLKKHLNQ